MIEAASTVAVVVPSPARSLVFLGDLAHHLSARVLELVFEFNLLGDGDAVLGDARRAVCLVEDNVTTLRTERSLDGIVENIDAAQQAVTGVGWKRTSLADMMFNPWLEMRGWAGSGRLFLSWRLRPRSHP